MKEKGTIGRIAFLINELYEKGYFTKKTLIDYIKISTKQEISKSTIVRTLKEMRDNFGLDIIYSVAEKKYYINTISDNALREENFLDRFNKVKRIPARNHELMIFYSFVKSLIFSEYYFPPMDNKAQEGDIRDYEKILRIIESILKEELSEKDIKLAGRIEYHLSEHYKLSQKNKFNKMLNVLLDAMRHENLVKFNYHDTDVIVEPIKIIHYDGKWFFMAYVVKSTRQDNLKKVRTYNLSLFKDNLYMTKEKFTQDDYIVPDYKDSFGIISTTNIETAKIRFYGQLADRMKEMLWVEKQKTSFGEDTYKGKYCEYSIPYPFKYNYELIAKVLSYGSQAEIIEPVDLRKDWIEEIKKMYEIIQ